MADPNFEFHLNKVVDEVKGDAMGVQGLLLSDTLTGEKGELKVDGVLVFVGISPNTAFTDVEKDDYGFIKTDRPLMTSAMGVFAVGDCRDTPLRQVATAVGTGRLRRWRPSATWNRWGSKNLFHLFVKR